MSFWYRNQQWQPVSTVKDGDSFFHATFGRNDEDLQAHFDPLANVRRMQWSAFLTYFESNAMPTCLEEQLQKCFIANKKLLKSNTDVLLDDYAEDVMRSGHEICIEEFPVLATLQNVHVVLFVDENRIPELFEPNWDLHGKYPIENTNPLIEAVIWLEGSAFVQLQSERTETRETVESSDPITDLSIVESSITQPTDTYGISKAGRYMKRQGCSIGGILYELNLLSVFLTNGIKKFSKWRLSINREDADYFDDAVFELLPSKEAILIQAKYRPRPIFYKDLFDSKIMGLQKFYFSYERIKRNFKIRNVVLCTNADLGLGGKLDKLVNREELKKDSIFHYEEMESRCYTFNENAIPDLKEYLEKSKWEKKDTISEENIRQFINHFQIIALYPSKNNFDKIIGSIISSLGYSNQFDTKDYAQHLNKKIVDWYDDKRGRYLTEVDAKAFLCGYRSNKFCGKLHDIKIHFKADRLAFDSVKRILHIVPHKENTLNLIKVHQFLQKIDVISLIVNPNDSLNIQRQTVEAFEAPEYTYLVICVDTKNEEVIQETYDKIIKVLKKFVYKKVILIAAKNDRYVQNVAIGNKDLYERLEDNISFTDLTEQSQERLLEEVIVIFETNL